MGLFVGFFLIFIGYAMSHSQKQNFQKIPDRRTPEEIERAELKKEWETHPVDHWEEHLLVYIVYAYYTRQPEREDPFRDAILHTRLYEIQQGKKCSVASLQLKRKQVGKGKGSYSYERWETDWSDKYMPIDLVDWEFFHQMEDPEYYYWRGKDREVPRKNGFHSDILPGEPFGWFEENTNWPFPGGLYQRRLGATIWPGAITNPSDVFNRITEWYYLVMFRDEFLASGANIRDALFDEEPHSPAVERQIESTVQSLLSTGQEIVQNGDWWEKWTREQIELRENNAAAQAEADHVAREAPGIERRRKLLYGEEIDTDAASYYSPDWARQQLKEKYGIDYSGDSQDSN